MGHARVIATSPELEQRQLWVTREKPAVGLTVTVWVVEPPVGTAIGTPGYRNRLLIATKATAPTTPNTEYTNSNESSSLLSRSCGSPREETRGSFRRYAPTNFSPTFIRSPRGMPPMPARPQLIYRRPLTSNEYSTVLPFPVFRTVASVLWLKRSRRTSLIKVGKSAAPINNMNSTSNPASRLFTDFGIASRTIVIVIQLQSRLSSAVRYSPHRRHLSSPMRMAIPNPSTPRLTEAIDRTR